VYGTLHRVRTFLDRPQSTLFRRALFQIHIWVGVLAGFYIFVVCTSGAALVFRIEMQRAIHPWLFTPTKSGPVAHPADVIESVTRSYPNQAVFGVDAPTTTRPTYLAYAGSNDRLLTLLLDPVDASVLGELPDRSFVRSLQELHFDLLAGRTGRTVNGLGALCLLLMCATGIGIWWPGRPHWHRGFTVDFRRHWTRVAWDVHTTVGACTVVLIAMWAVTALDFTFPNQFRAGVNAVSPLAVTRAPESDVSNTSAHLDWRALIDKAGQLTPGHYVARVVLPSSPTAAFLVMFSREQPTTTASSDLASVYLDQYTGDLLAQPPATGRRVGDLVMAWVARLHVGGFGTTGLRIAWFILGLAPPTLFITGFIMWWTRVLRPRLRRT
jgi:uncharacterized iron-regulated membrane protein